jgi:hypothetical protein
MSVVGTILPAYADTHQEKTSHALVEYELIRSFYNYCYCALDIEIRSTNIDYIRSQLATDEASEIGIVLFTHISRFALSIVDLLKEIAATRALDQNEIDMRNRVQQWVEDLGKTLPRVTTTD